VIISRLLGGIILGLCVYYIFHRFQKDVDSLTEWSEAGSILQETRSIFLVIFVAMLSIINWMLESVKWRFLLRKIFDIRLGRAFKSVLTGLAFTVITPYRVGSFIGRVWTFPKEKRYESVLASIFGGLAQLFVTVCLGLVALIFHGEILNNFPVDYITYISSVLLVVIVTIYFYPNIIISWLDQVLPSTNFSKAFLILKEYGNRDKFHVLAYSMLRYLVFLLQFYILLFIFIPDLNLTNLFWPLALVFFILSVLPTIVFGLGLREASALVVLSPIFASESSVVIASLLLWILNMILPACAGAIIFMLRKQELK